MRSSALPSVTAMVALLTLTACGGGSKDPIIACTNPVGVSEAAQIGADQILLHAPNVRVGTPLSFQVPPNIASLTIIEQAMTAPATVTITSAGTSTTWENMAVPLTVTEYVTSPSGRTIYDDNTNFPGLTPEQREQLFAYVPAAGAGAGALIVPTTSGGLGLVGPNGLPSGPWSMVVSDLAWECASFNWSPNSCSNGSTSSLYDVTVIAKPLVSGSLPTAGTLDVAVHFATTSAGGSPLSADTANAGRDQDLNRMASSLAGLLSKTGITVGTITYVDLPASVQTTYATGVDVTHLDPCAPLGQLLKQGAGGKTLNVFLVSSIKVPSDTGVPNKVVVALDGAIPGPATVGGTTESGIVASAGDLRSRTSCGGSLNLTSCGADKIAYYIAHEAGHFLGLSHPTELYGFRYDALADTPRCPCTVCKSSTATDTCASSDATASTTSHTMSVSECTRSNSCGGGDNLMFWTLLAGTSTGNVTTEQKRVLLANPLLQ